MSAKHYLPVTIFVLLSCVSALKVQAGVILDSTSEPLGGNDLAATPSKVHAVVIESSIDQTLTSLKFLPLLDSVTTPATVQYLARLYNVSGTTPAGTPIATSTASIFVTGHWSTVTTADSYTWDLTSNATGSWLLSANTTYAIGISSDTTNAAWGFVTGSVTDTSDAQYLGRAYSPDGGNTYGNSATTATPWFQLSSTPASSPSSTVPEPSTVTAMGLLGLVGFAGNRRRRRQVSAA